MQLLLPPLVIKMAKKKIMTVVVMIEMHSCKDMPEQDTPNSPPPPSHFFGNFPKTNFAAPAKSKRSSGQVDVRRPTSIGRRCMYVV